MCGLIRADKLEILHLLFAIGGVIYPCSMYSLLLELFSSPDEHCIPEIGEIPDELVSEITVSTPSLLPSTVVAASCFGAAFHQQGLASLAR